MWTSTGLLTLCGKILPPSSGLKTNIYKMFPDQLIAIKPVGFKVLIEEI
jgi:hypothetical protein